MSAAQEPAARPADASSARRVFLQRAGFSALLLGLGEGGPLLSRAVETASPEALGIASGAIRDFLQAAAAGKFELHSFAVERHSRIAAQGCWAPYRPDVAQELYSLSKSFTSTAVGLAISAGKLKLTDRVLDYFPDQAPAQVSANLSMLRVEHLLTMTSGHASDPTPLVTREHDWAKTFLSLPLEHAPGSVFVYNSAASYMLSAIVQKAVGEKIVDYLRPRFFDPLEMPAMHWATCPLGINTGGWGLYATTTTLAKFGQFYLQKGAWKGRQLLPRSWIEQATSFQIQQPAAPGQNLDQLKQTSDWHQGYGYQFWRCRHDAYRGDGAFGQFCIVLPQLDAVIAITSRTLDMQGLLDLVWKHLLPGIGDAKSPVDGAARDGLRAELAALSLALPQGSPTAPAQAASTDYQIESNSIGIERVTIDFAAQSCRLMFATASKSYPISAGIGRWLDGETALPGTPPEFTELVGVDATRASITQLAAAGAWTDAQTFEMQWRYVETPHFDTVTCRFDGDKIEIRFLNSLTQMAAAVHPETRPLLKGRKRA